MVINNSTQVKQLSVSLENVPGSFSTVSELLGREGGNIRAISVADTSDISTVRFVVDDPEKAKNILTGHGYNPRETEVLAVEVADMKLGDLLMPLRVALTGSKVSPPLVESIRVMGADTARRRAEKALAVLEEFAARS